MAISQNKELNYNLDKMNDLTNKLYDDKLDERSNKNVKILYNVDLVYIISNL